MKSQYEIQSDAIESMCKKVLVAAVNRKIIPNLKDVQTKCFEQFEKLWQKEGFVETPLDNDELKEYIIDKESFSQHINYFFDDEATILFHKVSSLIQNGSMNLQRLAMSNKDTWRSFKIIACYKLIWGRNFADGYILTVESNKNNANDQITLTIDSGKISWDN